MRLSERLRGFAANALTDEAADLLDECLRNFDLIDYELTHGDIGRAVWIARKAAKQMRMEE